MKGLVLCRRLAQDIPVTQSVKSARTTLRDLTHDNHGIVDGLFSKFDLTQRNGYRLFLTAQAAAFLPAEAQLEAAGVGRIVPDWPERRRGPLLLADLADLGARPDAPVAAPPLPSDAAVLGALYVLEGSRLGGQLLRRNLPDGAPCRFLAAETAPGAWRALTQHIDKALPGEAEQADAVAAARAIFDNFATAARQALVSA